MKYSDERLALKDIFADPNLQELPRVQIESVKMGVDDDNEPYLAVTGSILNKDFTSTARRFRISAQAAKELASVLSKCSETLLMYDHYNNGPF